MVKVYKSVIHMVFIGLVNAASFSRSNTLFGTAIKNGPIPAHSVGEWEVFSHTCMTSPCAITQLQIPSITPGLRCPSDWGNAVLRVYIDDSSIPTVELKLLQIATVGAESTKNGSPGDLSPFSAGSLFGKYSRSGGVWSTMRIPFGLNVRITLRQAATCEIESSASFIVRGIEGLQLRLGELDLPPTARLVQSSIQGTVFEPNAFVPLSTSPEGTDGMLLQTSLYTFSSDLTFLEGCLHLTLLADNSTIFLSSGTDDYFLATNGFDRGSSLHRSRTHRRVFLANCVNSTIAHQVYLLGLSLASPGGWERGVGIFLRIK